MNKKFSTLVAMLLASGGLFYAVDAMVLPASEGVAKTFVAVATSEGTTEATAEVVACNFKIASEFTAAWKVVKVGDAFYLEVKAAPGWFLCEDGIKKVEGTDYAAAGAIAVKLAESGYKLLAGAKEVVIAENGAVTLAESGGNAYLYTAAETPLGSLTENTVVALSTEKTVNAVGASDVKWNESGEGTEIAANSYNSASIEAGEIWTATIDDGKLTLKASTKFLSAPTSAGNATLVETASATAITMDEDGALKSGDLFLVKGESSIATVEANSLDGKSKLYLFTKTGELVSNKESVGNEATYLIAELKSTTTADKSVDVEVVKQVPGAPGIDVPGMEGIQVSKDGEITVAEELTAIPAPHTISIDNKFLSVKDGAVVYLSDKDAANATSWILKDGKYMSVEMAKLGKANAWLGNAPAGKAVAKTSYALVAAKDAIDAKATSAGVTLGNTPITATLTTTGTAVPVDVTLNPESKLNSVSNGDVVTLGNGTSMFLDEDGKSVASIDDAALWVVNMSARADGSYNYSFKLKDSDPAAYLTVGGTSDFVAEKYAGAFALKSTDGKYLTIATSANGSASLETQSASSVLYGVPVSTKPFSAEEILSNHGTLTSFNLSLWDEKDGVSNLVQNPFEDADLVPVYYNSADKTFTPITANYNDANKGESTFLLKKGDSYIVAETTKDSEWSNINTELIAGGFKFVTLSEKAMAEVMTKDGKWKEGTYAPYFTFNYNENAVANGVATAKTPIYSINVATVAKASVGNVSTFTIKTNTEAATYLTTSSKSDYWVYAEFSANNAVRGDSDKDYNPLNMKYVNITFVNHSSITWNDIKLDGKVLGAEAKPADAANFLFSKPEGQWAVKMTAATGDLSKGKELGDNVYGFTFVNRENNNAKYVVNKLFYLGNNKYAVSYSNTYDKFAENTGTLRDTIAITPVEGLKNNTRQFDGYKNMTAQEVQDQLFNLLVASAEEDYYVGENHTAKSHFLGLSHSEEAAVNWRIVPLTAARTYDADKELTQASDSVYVFNNPQYYKASDKKFYQYNDTVAIISYALQNVANDEFLTYENPQTTDILSMICDPNFKSYKTTKNISDAYRFVLKEKGTDLYNIIAVDYPKYDTKGEFVAEGENAWASLNLNRKLYGATTLTKQGAVEVEGAYEQINSNDLFKVQKVGAPEYRLMNMGDTIRIFRQENEYDQMFEKGEFLNIGNKAQLTDMAPALYVDTAYVKRGHNNRYQYLLVVNPNYVPAEPCNIPGHPTVHPDTTYGRFLVNLIDTANVAYQKGAIHANKYINDTEAGEKFAKLGFVYGFRTADKLYITDKNFQKSGKASDVIDLSTRDFNVAKFAFRYINPINHESDGSFKIQTGFYNYNSYIATNKQPEVENNGYLKNINGVVVVAKGYEAGDQFDLAIEHSDPTANEGISANGVSVAAIDGAVIVKGAAGKTVVITNILGQTIANAVLSSDNETIAAPAGVVVVAVEGEAAVKAIVK